MTIEEYLSNVPADRSKQFAKLRNCIKENLPMGFVEEISYGMIGYVVPHSIYSPGYHCDPKLPLPFMNLASTKNSITLYHMGLYGKKDLYDWFVGKYAKESKHKIDCGKSCIRFKYFDEIPYTLISEVVKKISVSEWIEFYEKNYKNKRTQK